MIASRRSGFTIIELLVAMTIFAVVVTVATGGFIRALRTQRQLVSLAAANSNLSLVLEQMAREIRVGSEFVADDSTLTFKNGKKETVTYAHAGASITRNGQSLTSETVDVRQLSFAVQFAEDDDLYPARVTIIASVAPTETSLESTLFHIQTTISARNLGT